MSIDKIISDEEYAEMWEDSYPDRKEYYRTVKTQNDIFSNRLHEVEDMVDCRNQHDRENAIINL